MFEIRAPAKVNLYLHVGQLQSDGRHPLDSLVVFADSRAADTIRFEPGDNPLRFLTTGNTAAGALGPDEDNLVIRAVRSIEKATGITVTGTLTLDKYLPVAAGVGGGSADAAATLLLLNGALDLLLSQDELNVLARPLGGDVPACVSGRPVLMRGDGARIVPFNHDLPQMHAVLVTPDLMCPTGPVFRQFDLLQGANGFSERPAPVSGNIEEFCACLTQSFRNDLQDAAIRLHPEIGDLLEALRASQASCFSSMSGSGATCFSVFANATDADTEAHRLRQEFPAYRVMVTQLGAAGFDPMGFSL